MTMRTREPARWMLVLCGLAWPGAASAVEPLRIGSALELAVEPRWIASLRGGATLVAHPPQPREVVLERTGGNGYMTVLKDGDTYRMYYRYVVPSRDQDGHEFYCYAESRDGLRWTKPDLDLFTIPGSDARNAITEENRVRPADAASSHYPCISHNLRPFIDTRPGVPAGERFKALAAGYNSRSPKAGYWALVSADGIHWRKLRDEWVIDRSHWPYGSDSTPACVFWSESEGTYVAYIRIRVDPRDPTVGKPGGLRWIGRLTSGDFIRWSKVTPMRSLDATGPSPAEVSGRAVHFYTNEVEPYFRNPALYVATPARFFEGSPFSAEEVERLPEVMRPADPLSRGHRPDAPGAGFTDAILLTSRPGALEFRQPFAEAFLRPGLNVVNWGNRSTYPNVNIVPTGSGEMSLYVRHGAGLQGFIQRYALRTDGFASVRATLAGGEVLTRPLAFAGTRLVINYATSAAGSVRVEVQDEAGRPIAGLRLDDALRCVGDAIEQAVRWKSAADVGRLAGRTVRLRFVMHDADLFSFRFR